ncbi:MAG: tetratricopeptide repeat protein, partial [Ktedonobacteraceae bacterium]|nr:tetratricopeptide repeat protein [Ktedonobacteraceae bacterium]
MCFSSEEWLHTNALVASAVMRLLTPEQRHERETLLIETYTAWLSSGRCDEREASMIVADLATLLLRHQRLLPAAEYLIRYGWMSFNLGYGPRLAQIAKDVMQRFDWQTTTENECAGILLHYFLSPFIGEVIDYTKRYVEYQYILNTVIAEKIVLHYATQVHIIHHMMFCAMLQSRFEEAQTLFQGCYSRLESFFASDADLETDVLEERASLFSRWSAYLEEQGETQQARSFRDQCIAVYRQCCDLLTHHNEASSLQRYRLMKRLAAFLNNLAYQLNRNGQFAEALQAEEQSIALKEQGYRQFGGLAASYGEKSQILAGLGRFQEALQFDEMAVADAQQSAGTNHTFSQEDLWIYSVNRARLYLRLGRVTEAERLLQEALSQETDTSRRSYRMFAKEALDEIDQWRRNAASSRHQLDWRWVERYREIDAYDAYWWWSQAGPFTQEEQQQW